MGFTIEDMLTLTGDRYHLSLAAGSHGWSNSISWVFLLEDLTVVRNFAGKELAVTTGMGFDTEEKMLSLVRMLKDHHAAGLIVNTGFYLQEVPQSVIDYCNEEDLPLLTVPWEIYIAEMIKDLSVRIFLQGMTDEQIAAAFIKALSSPDMAAAARQDLLQYFDVDGDFQIILLTMPGLDTMDTVERRRIGYRMELYLENVTHNCSFFYYDSCFVLICNNLPQDLTRQVIEDFEQRITFRMPESKVFIGISSRMKDLNNLHLAYCRARAALDMASMTGKRRMAFDEMGIFRLLYLIPDKALLREMSEDLLRPLLDYDQKHDGQYVETLDCYLKTGGSFAAMSEIMFVHRNTLLYRMNNIKKLLGTDLASNEDRLNLQIACLILNMTQKAAADSSD